MDVIWLKQNDKFWNETIMFAKSCSWEAGRHLAELMENNRFFDWESVFIAVEEERILGYCAFLNEDYFPENRYSPWISTIFADEGARGNRISQNMIEKAIQYAKEKGFKKVYIPSDKTGLYEKYGFIAIDRLINFSKDIDTVFMKEI